MKDKDYSKKHYSKKNKCIDCNVIIHNDATRCLSCNLKKRPFYLRAKKLRKCVFCRNEFLPFSPSEKTCSLRCSHEYENKKNRERRLIKKEVIKIGGLVNAW